MNAEKQPFVVIIPALDPDEKMIQLIKQLKEENVEEILLVNDGSSDNVDSLFKQAKEKYGCLVLKHYKNLGKGRALKNAFNYVLSNFPNIKGVITADSDGQHSVKDILACAELIEKSCEEKIIFLGTRDFEQGNIPARSAFGNKCTRIVLNLFCGIKISDTQTGLRGITKPAMEEMLEIFGERYEYEMNMLIETKEREIKIEEFAIDTIYIDGNATSHFNPIKDSIKIYKQFLKYMVASISSFVIDIVLFAILSSLLMGISNYIFIATYGARGISSVYNFFVNRLGVFKSKENMLFTVIKYFGLVIVQGSVSALLVQNIYNQIGGGEVVIKVIVDSILFFLSFFIQKKLVFKK